MNHRTFSDVHLRSSFSVHPSSFNMAWLVEDRRREQVAKGDALLTEEMKTHLREKYFPRYPTKRAVLLPALHYVQHAYGWIPTQALQEVAEFLELAPAEVLDTATFYEEYWLKPKGKFLVQVCRSLSCEICDSDKLTEMCRRKLGIDVGETTADGRFTLVELECLGACGTAPVALVNEVLYEELTPAKLQAIIDKLPDDPHDYHDPSITWKEEAAH
jgi:NADH-quinone oxidoreductase subunit E